MRRNEKEIKDQKEVMKLFSKASVCRIAFNDTPYPYMVPVHFVCVKDCFYFHSAMIGRKIDLIKKNCRICFETDQQIENLPSEKACNWSTKYESVIGIGNALMIHNINEKKEALLHLMEKYTGKRKWKITHEALLHLAVVKIDIVDISGKFSGF